MEGRSIQTGGFERVGKATKALLQKSVTTSPVVIDMLDRDSRSSEVRRKPLEFGD
jgi:hypothetical protein